MMFVDRKEELNLLEKLFQKKDAQLIILYGRRRIGKTELLRQSVKDKKHLFFSADLSSEQEQLRQFTEKIYHISGDSFLQTQPFISWESLLRYVFDHLASEVPIIIDEFPYLCVSNPALPSILQKVWDEKSKERHISLVLCGSYMSFMEKEVLSSRSPLFGRRTAQIFLQPLPFKELKYFFPQYSKEEQVYTYAVAGGTPAYLQKITDKNTLAENVKTEILNKNAFLYNESRFLLMEELREPSLYFAILKAIASGKTKLKEIVQDTGIKPSYKVNKYIAVLRELRIVRRELPITEEMPHKSRKGIYILNDPFFRFWFKYVYPNVSYLEEGDVNYVWEEKIKPDLDNFAGFIFEDICIQKIKELNRENKLPFKAERIGRWWDSSDEIDVVAYNSKNEFMFFECKWRKRELGMNVLNDLKRKANKFSKAKHCYFGFFSKSGFSEKLTEASGRSDNIFLFNY